MPSLTEKIDSDLKSAMKASEGLRVSVLRMLKAALKNRQIQKGSALSEEDEVSVLTSLSKQRKESIEQYLKAGREDLANKERDELAILQSYLPEQLSTEELDRIILETIKDSGAKGPSDMGKVMKLLMPKVKGRADGKVVSERLKALLG